MEPDISTQKAGMFLPATTQKLRHMRLTVSCFGIEFPWKNVHYQDFSGGVPIVRPIFERYRIKEALIPDFRGMNALAYSENERLLQICDSPKLYKTPMSVDAVITPLPVLSITADCHTVILVAKKKPAFAVLHCGRDSLQPFQKNGGRRAEGYESVIDTVCRRLWPLNPSHIYAHICCGIGKESFENRADADQHGFYKKVVHYFVDTCGKEVVHGPRELGYLNMPLIIKRQLKKWGIPNKNITWDTLNTYADPRFNSRRRTREGNNGVLIVPT